MIRLLVSFNPRLPGGRRLVIRAKCALCCKFQSTPSGGKATFSGFYQVVMSTVSIHAFRGEGDPDSQPYDPDTLSFNPRLPGGRRRQLRVLGCVYTTFQSTPSGGKATAAARDLPSARAVSIHAFRGEGDRPRCSTVGRMIGFQSTPSGGKATTRLGARSGLRAFQSTPSGGKATAISRAAVPCSRQIL